MEDMFWKFPHINANIFKKLSNKNLAKCRKVGRTWADFIKNERFYKQRVKYENIQKVGDEKEETPLHKAAKVGDLEKCKLIIKHVENKNPNIKTTPLHLAAWNGHLSVCKLIVNNVQDKYPRAYSNRLPQKILFGHVPIK